MRRSSFLQMADDEKVNLLCHYKQNTEAYSLTNTYTCMEMKAVEPRNNCLSAQTTLITFVSYMYVCARAHASVFILGHERIGHAQFVVAAVGVLPVSVPHSGFKNRPGLITDLCFAYITSRRE